MGDAVFLVSSHLHAYWWWRRHPYRVKGLVPIVRLGDCRRRKQRVRVGLTVRTVKSPKFKFTRRASRVRQPPRALSISPPRVPQMSRRLEWLSGCQVDAAELPLRVSRDRGESECNLAEHSRTKLHQRSCVLGSIWGPSRVYIHSKSVAGIHVPKLPKYFVPGTPGKHVVRAVLAAICRV